MPVRHIALAAAAVLVTGMCVYLFLEVRSSPAAPQVQVATKDAEPDPHKPDHREADHDETSSHVSSRGKPHITRAKAGDAGEASHDSEPPAAEPGKLEGVKLSAVMDEANKAYDKMDFEEARSIAQRVLKQHPTNVRMLRIMASSACVEVDAPEAQKWFNLLPAQDRAQIKTRCARYNVTLTDPPAK